MKGWIFAPQRDQVDQVVADEALQQGAVVTAAMVDRMVLPIDGRDDHAMSGHESSASLFLRN